MKPEKNLKRYFESGGARGGLWNKNWIFPQKSQFIKCSFRIFLLSQLFAMNAAAPKGAPAAGQ
jgi:hypothetical protein